MSNMSDFEQWALNNGYCYRDLVKTHEGQYSQPIAIHAYKAFCGAKQSMQGEALAWRRLEDGQWVYYETKAWDDLTELYTHAPDSAARIAEQDAEIARLQKEFEEARKDALEEAAKIVDSWENAASIEGFNTDSISNEIRAAIDRLTSERDRLFGALVDANAALCPFDQKVRLAKNNRLIAEIEAKNGNI